MYFNFNLNNDLKNANTKNSPTPTPTDIIKVYLFIVCDNCSAKTVKSGSETVIKTPTKKNTGIMSHNFLVLTTPVPTYSPIGVIAVSAPSVNSPIPTTTNKTHTINVKNVSDGIGAIVKHKRRTIKDMGSTEENDSFILSKIIVLSLYINSLFFFKNASFS